ncbi:MAG: outer membrane beta-barrel protein, partial [Bacteroidota bacterium]
MKISSLSYLFLFAGVLLASCHTEHMSKETKMSAQASVDYSRTHETGNSELKYDPKVGANVFLWTEMSLAEFSMTEPGHVGIDDEFETEKKQGNSVSLKIGLGYIMKGQKLKQSDTKYTFSYLELPIFALYHHPVGGAGGIFAGLGPYFAYGVGGKVKSPGFSESVFGQDNGGYKRFDA